MTHENPAENIPQSKVDKVGSNYEYQFNPPLDYPTVKALSDALYKGLDPLKTSYGFKRGQKQPQRADGGLSAPHSEYVLEMPAHLSEELAKDILARLNATGLVHIELTTEEYVRDTRPVLELAPGERVIARVSANAKHQIQRCGIAVLDAAGNEKEFFPVDPPSSDPVNAMNAVQNAIPNRFKIQNQAS